VITVKGDVKAVERFLTRLEREQVPFASALALTRTAQHIQKKTIPAVLPRVFDRPTPFTRRGFYVIPAKKKDPSPEAIVQIKDGVTRQPGRGGKIGTPAFNYLKPQIAGGRRRHKGHERKLQRLGILGRDEYTVPGENMRMNRYGNLTGATYAKILADVQGNVGISEGFGQATTKRGKKRYFYDPNLRPRGIYLRTSRRRLIVALLFVKETAYPTRFDFEGISARVARKRFLVEFRKALSYALRTRR
jgi:hypothetical protein